MKKIPPADKTLRIISPHVLLFPYTVNDTNCCSRLYHLSNLLHKEPISGNGNGSFLGDRNCTSEYDF